MRTRGERIRSHREMVDTTARIQAAILRIKLRRLDEWNDTRRRVGATGIHYQSRFTTRLRTPTGSRGGCRSPR
jgi:dTDP-4-amino-4,6-dideoxygalactose transaminase